MEVPRHWRIQAQRYRLAGSTCPACGQPNFPPRRVCPHNATRQGKVAGHAAPASPTSDVACNTSPPKGG